jgi:subtilisin family serine protease
MITFRTRLFLITGLVALGLALAGMAVVRAGVAEQRPVSPSASPVSPPAPLPNDCHDITGVGEIPPACCAFGYVYFNGQPVPGAEVTIHSAGGVFTATTTAEFAGVAPYYAASLSSAPLAVQPGDLITVTAAFSGASQTTVYQVAPRGQQVDVVIPGAGGARPPIATINYIYPNPARQDQHMIAFIGSGADQDENGASVVAWEWSSDLDGVLSAQEDFLRAASRLSAGKHTISFRARDNEGMWSEPVTRSLRVDAPPGYSYWFPYLDPDPGIANCYFRYGILANVTAPAKIFADLNFNGRWDPGEPIASLAPASTPQEVFMDSLSGPARIISDQPLQAYVSHNANDCGRYDDQIYQYAAATLGTKFVVPLTGDTVYIVATTADTSITTPSGVTRLNAGAGMSLPASAGDVITADHPIGAALIRSDHANKDASAAVSLQPADRAGMSFWVPPAITLQATVLRDDSRLLLAHDDGTLEIRPVPAATAEVTTTAPAVLYWLADITTADPWDDGAPRRFQELWAIQPDIALGTEYANAGYLLSTHDDNLIRIDGNYDGVFERQVTLQSGQMLAPYTRFAPPYPHTALYTPFVGHVLAAYPISSWQAYTGNWGGTDEHLYGAELLPVSTGSSTADQPRITLAPASIAMTVPQGQSASVPLTIHNAGGAPLNFAIVEQVLTSTSTLVSTSASRLPDLPAHKVAATLLTALDDAPDGRAPILIYLNEEADLSAAGGISDWAARGAYVVRQLRETADRTQQELLAGLRDQERQGKVSEIHPFWIVNAVAVTGDRGLVDTLVPRADVAFLELAPVAAIPQPIFAGSDATPRGIEWNVSQIGADRVWRDFGVTGAGIVIGSIDTGADATHPALAGKYRGTETGSHDFNWYDPSGKYATAPGDDAGHGTHTVGTMVGEDGSGNQVGVAPGARWIAARGCAQGEMCKDLLSAAEWMLAPCPLGVAPGSASCDASKRPQIINNSWGSAGGDRSYVEVVRSWRAAGIFPAFAAGNHGNGTSCDGTISSPADYGDSFASGATDSADRVTDFSGRGPSLLTSKSKPDLVAPGRNVRSAVPGGRYASYDGTSMASPHTAGVAALILSANPTLSVDQVEALLTGTAHDLGRPGPDCESGYGRLDAYAAVAAAKDPVTWLTEAPVSGRVEVASTQVVTVTVNTSGLDVRPYATILLIVSDDPNAGILAMPITLTVTVPSLSSAWSVHLPLLMRR